MKELNLPALELWLSKAPAEQAVQVLVKLAEQMQVQVPKLENDAQLWLEQYREFLLAEAKKHFINPLDEPSKRDLRGIPCPQNSAKARVFLSKLSPGFETEIWLDAGAPIENVPGALIADGHQIISRHRKQEYWILKVKRRG